MPRSTPTDRDEIDRFKRTINLVQYAVEHAGYLRRARESSRSSQTLVHPPSHDKIIVARDTDEHWIYFSVRDPRDNGSIIDFVQQRQRQTLGEVRKHLREWSHSPAPLRAPANAPELRPTSRDSVRAAVAYSAAAEVPNSPYLNSRGLRPETLQDPRFAGTWRQDQRNNILFLHRDLDGRTGVEVSGFEIKNAGFTGFAAGGTKTAWLSAASSSDRALVLTETAIDALSYHQLHPSKTARYLSTAGTPSIEAFQLIERAITSMPAGSTIIAATDADREGHHLAARFAQIVATHPQLVFQRHTPTLGKDWNDHLQRIERDFTRAFRALEHGR